MHINTRFSPTFCQFTSVYQSLTICDVDTVKERALSQIRIYQRSDYAEFAESEPYSNVLRLVFHQQSNNVTSPVAVALEYCCYLVAEVLHLLTIDN